MTKYYNVRSGKYASKREAKRAQELRLLEKAGEISELREQVRYQVVPRQWSVDDKLIEREVTYVCDFDYLDKEGNRVVEDSKGHRTRDYIIKRKLMLHVHGIRIREV